MVYRKHGHEPSDVEIAQHGFKAFGPRRKEFTPTKDDFQRASRDLATGDPDELADVAEEVAEWWPQAAWYPFHFGFGYGWVDDV